MNRQEIRYIEIYNAKSHAEERLKELGKTLILKQRKKMKLYLPCLALILNQSQVSFSD